MNTIENFSNVTHYTNVQPGAINIEYVEHLHQADFLKTLGIELEIKKDGKTIEHSNNNETVNNAIIPKGELFQFFHPKVCDEQEMQQIHHEIVNLVSRNSIPDICDYLKTMADAKRILLPRDSQKAMKEFKRLGMPDEKKPGFGEKNWEKYYKMIM